MTNDEKKTLLGRIAIDARFREKLLRDPKAAAARLKIKLTQKEIEAIHKDTQAIRDNAGKFDQMRSSGGVETYLIPIIKVI